MYFNTKAECLQHLISMCDDGYLESTPEPDTFRSPGTYCLHHGESARPAYTPRRYKKGWAVCRLTYYYNGTLNTPPAATPCDMSIVEDMYGQRTLDVQWGWQ